jgi:radical SAM protein with 4Fe4S-binding SPASM domain
VRALRRRSKERKYLGPHCAVWELTLACNLNCIHCGSSAGRKRENELSLEESLKLCEDLKSIGCLGIALMGGEPFLHPHWYTIAQRVKDLDMALSIITNGWLGKDEKIIKKLVDLSPECVTVSLDGGEASVHDMIRGVKGSFERATAAIDTYVELGFPTTTITTVHKLNLSQLVKIREFLRGKGVAWQIQMATPFGRLERRHVLTPDEYYSVALFIAATRKQFPKDVLVAGAHDMGYYSSFLPDLQVKGWHGCQAGITTLGIQSNGNIVGCLALGDGFVEGNIRTKPLSETWYDDASFSYARHVKREDIGGHCRNCSYRSLCKGGCSSVSYTITGELHQDPFCLRHIEQRMKS